MGYFSNGTEGAIYEEMYCSRCVHSDHRPGKNFGDPDNPPCPIWMAHLLYAYELCNEKDHPGKVMLDSFIPIEKDELGYETVNGQCRMFVEKESA